MILQVKVKVRLATLQEFAGKLMSGQLDRSAIVSDTYCDKEDPACGVSYWKVDNLEEFEQKYSSWKPYYESYEIKEMISPKDAMMALFARNK